MSNTLKKGGREISFYLNSMINGKEAKTILFYPDFPHKRTIIYKILKHLKFNITSNPAHKFDLVFYWKDVTFRDEQLLLNKFNIEKVMNINCRDISKKNVSKVFEQVFNYSFDVDPKIYSGECVKKNNLNAKHDGIIVRCPLKKSEEGYVYQKIIDNKISDDLVLDLRVPVIKSNIPFIYLKIKKIEDRFTNDLYTSELASLNEYFTEDEIKKISEFCLRIGLDFGELDILKDKNDGKIYIVDVNYTPWGPPAKLSEEESRNAVIRMSKTFRNVCFS